MPSNDPDSWRTAVGFRQTFNTPWSPTGAPGLVEGRFTRLGSGGIGLGGGDLQGALLSVVGNAGLVSRRGSLSAAGDSDVEDGVEEDVEPLRPAPGGRLRGGLGGSGGGTLGDVGVLTLPSSTHDWSIVGLPIRCCMSTYS